AHQSRLRPPRAGSRRPGRCGAAQPAHPRRDRAGGGKRRAGDPELDRPPGRDARLDGRGARLRAGRRVDHRLRGGVDASMSTTSYPLNKILTAIARQHLMKDTLSDEEMVGHDLSDAERAALRAGDIERLYELGANPYL